MALRLGALHDALLNPGDADKAKLAAEELANYDNQLADIRSDVKLLKWMVGTNIVLTVGVLFRLLLP